MSSPNAGQRSVTRWCRVELDGRPRIGTVGDGKIQLFDGTLFEAPAPTDETIDVDAAVWLPPVVPRQYLGLWNNFRERQRIERTTTPDYPLFFAKLGDTLAAHEQRIRSPKTYQGIVKFEAELGIVIGQRSFELDRANVDDAIFGYTCVNDITAATPLFANPEFPQWCRAKSFPGFGPVGPTIATGIDPLQLTVRAILDGKIKQDYPVSDMIFSPQEIVWHLSQEMTLFPGDVIACGTSVGAEPMHSGQTIAVEIPGVGLLRNYMA